MNKYWLFPVLLLGLAVTAVCSADGTRPAGAVPAAKNAKATTPDPLLARKQQLTAEQFHVTQESGTEPPFHNAYWNNHAAGIYVDVVSGEALFSSKEKFESGTGWPSFWAPLDPKNVVARQDSSLGISRDEVRSRQANSHLGHVFDDGPAPTKLRYCINSAALRFIPAERLTVEGYGAWASRFPDVKQVPAPTR